MNRCSAPGCIRPRGVHITYVACPPTAGTAGLQSPAEVAEVFWCPLTQLDAYVPTGIFGPVRNYLTPGN
jgi:8-oxo-dGTP diphosphatase